MAVSHCGCILDFGDPAEPWVEAFSVLWVWFWDVLVNSGFVSVQI